MTFNAEVNEPLMRLISEFNSIYKVILCLAIRFIGEQV